MGSRKKASPIEKIEENIEFEVPRLKADEFWQWKYLISEMFKAKKEKELAESQLIALKKDIEIANIKAKLFELSQIETAKDKIETSTKAYSDYKNDLEKVHKISLSGKIIDEVTYEIKELQE
jgi:5'-3' exonuclease